MKVYYYYVITQFFKGIFAEEKICDRIYNPGLFAADESHLCTRFNLNKGFSFVPSVSNKGVQAQIKKKQVFQRIIERMYCFIAEIITYFSQVSKVFLRQHIQTRMNNAKR